MTSDKAHYLLVEGDDEQKLLDLFLKKLNITNDYIHVAKGLGNLKNLLSQDEIKNYFNGFASHPLRSFSVFVDCDPGLAVKNAVFDLDHSAFQPLLQFLRELTAC